MSIQKFGLQIMKPEDVSEVLSCLADERRVLHYFKDRYCLDLIDFEMQRQGATFFKVNELKKSSMARFMNKPIMAQVLKECGSGKLDCYDLQKAYPTEHTPLVLNLTRWGDGDRGYDQTSRNQCNLVLQVNFDGGHVSEYNRRIKPDDDYGPFEFWGHPVNEGKRKTLSWVRMDIDFSTGEVLIEEIQSDWLRQASRALARVKRCRSKEPAIKPNDVDSDIHGKYEDLEHYVECTLKPYRKLWAEASMLAAIKFIREELGISTIFYHSFDTGKKIKKVFDSPPKSVYTQLPKQFGFELSDQAPEFLRADKFSRRCIKAIENPHWFRLDV